ncbi:MAG: DUF3256 family protein [Muribaculaceae bacterium]|nr:DUF3256 family protein [Muribaculaceae bacterium]
MRKLLLTMFTAAVAGTGACALSPREAFVNAPRRVIAAIDSITRLDMLDYYASGSSVASRNAFGGDSRVTLLSDDAITVSTSTSSEVMMAVLPGQRDSMLLVVNTLALPAPDSKAVVYDRHWGEAGKKLQLPDHNDLSIWLRPESKSNCKELENLIPFIPAIYTYKDGVLTATNTLGRLIPADDYKKIKSCLKPSVSYRWDGKKWAVLK